MKFFSSAKKSLINLNKIWQEASEQTRKNAAVKSTLASELVTSPIDDEEATATTTTTNNLNTIVKEASSEQRNLSKKKSSKSVVAPLDQQQLPPEHRESEKETKIKTTSLPYSELARIWLEASSRDLQLNQENLDKQLKTLSLPLQHSNLAKIYLEAMANANTNNTITTLPATLDKKISNPITTTHDTSIQYNETNVQSDDDENDESFSSYYVNHLSQQQQSTNKSDEIITVNGVTGVWVNKEECLNWRGPIPLEHYKINQDSNPTVIRKKRVTNTEAVQRVCVRFLKPPPLPAPGDLIIKEEAQQLPPAPPIVIRQQADATVKSSQPIIIREKPPRAPASVPVQTITIPGERKLELPPRQVIIERVPASSTNSQDIIVERWLSYPRQKRNIIYDKHSQSQENVTYKKPQNIIIDWETTPSSHFVEATTTTTSIHAENTNASQYRSQPNIIIDWEASDQQFHTIENINTNVTFLGVEEANPFEYANKHSSELVDAHDLPHFVNEYKTPLEEQLASNLTSTEQSFILTGDIDALQLVTNRNELNKYLLTKF